MYVPEPLIVHSSVAVKVYLGHVWPVVAVQAVVPSDCHA